MKTQYYTATSLDGFIATEDDSLDWLFPLGDMGATSYPSFIAEVGALAMGSTTYEWMLRHTEEVVASVGSPWPYSQPTWVFSSRPVALLEGNDIRIARGDVRPVHAEMRAAAGSKNIWIVGGGDLAGQFYDAGLLNEIIVQIGSVTLGRGRTPYSNPATVTSKDRVSAEVVSRMPFRSISIIIDHTMTFSAITTGFRWNKGLRCDCL
jgi:dihydrofolate reductase